MNTEKVVELHKRGVIAAKDLDEAMAIWDVIDLLTARFGTEFGAENMTAFQLACISKLLN